MDNLRVRLKHLVVSLNLFESRASARDGDARALRHEIIATRLFLVLLGIILCVLLSYLSTEQLRQSATVQSPSLETFERLHNQYSSTLTCPCSQVTIRYDHFLTIEPVYHQVTNKCNSFTFL